MDRLRTPFLVVALIAFFLICLCELGSLALLGSENDTDLTSPGLGIPMMAFTDGIVFSTLLMMTLAVVISPQVFGAIQGIISFIVMLLTVIGGIIAIYIAFGLLMLMFSLLMAVPFGTAVYFAAYADFEVGEARAVLSAILLFKIVAVVCVFLAQQKFLEVKGLVFLVLCSFLAGFVISLLHALPPGFLVSITDAVKAGPPDEAVQVAFTHDGLRVLGVADYILDQFSHEFRTGMHEPNRSRRLGDVGSNNPDNWYWGQSDDVPHMLVMLFAKTEGMAALEKEVKKGRWS